MGINLRIAIISLFSLSTACGGVAESPDAGDTIDAAPPDVTVTITRSGTSTGTVTGSGIDCGATCSVTVPSGTELTLTATADAGAEFTGWTGAGCTGTGTCTFTATAAVSIDAGFDVAAYTLSVTKNGNGDGTVTSSPAGIDCGSDCSEGYAYDTDVVLTAVADAGSTFVGWSGACTGTGSCVVDLTADIMVTASFVMNNTLMVDLAGNGLGAVTSTPAGIDCGTDCMEEYAPGTVVTLSAMTIGDTTFTGWSGGGCTGTGTCVVTLDTPVMVTATFTLNQHNLIVTRSGNGTGTVTSAPAGIDCGTDCNELFDSGTMVTLTATPDAGFAFRGWSGGGCTGTGTCVVTMTVARTVNASFDPAQCDSIAHANSSTIPGWTERGGDWVIDAGRLRHGSTGGVYTNYVTKDGSSQTDGCAQATAIYGAGPANVQAIGIVLRWTSPNNYVVGLVQDNSNNGQFNTMYIYQYPGQTQLGTLGGLSLGTTPKIKGCLEGNTYTLAADSANDGTFETSLTATTTTAGAGLGGVMMHTFGAPALADNFCWGAGGCDTFNGANSTTIPNWTERTGDWQIDSNRIRHGTTGGVYSHHITKNGSAQTNGCVHAVALYGPGPANVQAVGVLLRWTMPNNYVVALVQDNSNNGQFNTMYIYQYPGVTSLGSLSGLSLGTSPAIDACVVGTTVTLRADTNQDGVYENTLTGTTTLTGAGLAGVMTHTFGAQAFADNVCWGLRE